jgi:hypothetical protein
MGKIGNAHKILVGKPERGRKSVGVLDADEKIILEGNPSEGRKIWKYGLDSVEYV